MMEMWTVKVCIVKHLFDTFPIQSGLKQGDALSPLLFNFALGYGIRKIQKKKKTPGRIEIKWDTLIYWG
jgi:hypothetical protein